MWIDDLINRAKRRIASAAIDAAVSEAARQWRAQHREASAAQEKADEEAGYTRLSSRSAQNLNPIDQDKLLRMVHYLYYKNPLARRMVEIPRDFNFRMTVQPESSTDPAVTQVIQEFWSDPHNRMDLFLPQIIERRALEGETLLPVRVNPQNGKVWLDFEEPREIDEITSVDNRYVETVKLKKKRGEREARVLRVIRYETNPDARWRIGEAEQGNAREVPSFGFRVGDAFYFRSNHLITGRGRPPMEPIVDWLDAHDHTLFDQFRNVALSGAFVWDCELIGAQQAQVDQRRDEINTEGPPKPGSILVHNDKEKWTSVHPKADGTVVTDLPIEARKLIALNHGLSETWVAAASDVNRSTAETADQPPLRHMDSLQHETEWMIRDIIDFVIDMAIMHGALTIAPDDHDRRAFRVVVPDLSSADNATTARALVDITSAVQMAMDARLCDLATARSLWYQIAGVPMSQNLDENLDAQEEQAARADYAAGAQPPDRPLETL